MMTKHACSVTSVYMQPIRNIRMDTEQSQQARSGKDMNRQGAPKRQPMSLPIKVYTHVSCWHVEVVQEREP